MARKSGKKSSALNALKRKLTGKEGTAFEILDDVKKVNPQQWRNPSQVEKLARKYIDKLGLSVPEERIKQFVDAYKDAVTNGSNVDELIQKYGKNVDKETVKTIKKYIPK
jgi:adenine-specific DNA methylase